MDRVQRSFGRLPRNTEADQSKSIPLSPSARSDAIESSEGPGHWESTRDSFQQSSTRAGFTYDGTTNVRVRNKLSPAEESHWQKAEKDPFLGKRKRGGLEVFPKFFNTYEEASLELKQGLINIWSTFAIADSLLISIAIQPFVTSIPNLSGWKLKVYGGFWMLVLVSDVLSFCITALFLGYLHAYPGKLTYMWLCHIGQWAGIPSLLVVTGGLITLGAIAFSSWVIYGSELGIICAAIEVLVVIIGFYTSSRLAKAGKAMEALE